MKELDFINKYLGGHKITVNGLRNILKQGKYLLPNKKLVVCEIGCGGGDNLNVLHAWCKKNKVSACFVGVDINEHCIAFAKSRINEKDVSFICSDYKLTEFPEKPDIIFSSLFCHHFANEELKGMNEWLKNNASIGFFINDLHRHWLAYYTIKILTAIFSKSYLVKNDAPISVLRGFKKNELKEVFTNTNMAISKTKWAWAFRWLVIHINKTN
ncbi:MAG: methyltransferase domain-containing protein [Ferruginibacter sp.]